MAKEERERVDGEMCVAETFSELWDVCNFKKDMPTWSETIAFCTFIHSWLVFDLGRDEWVIWRMATIGIPLCRRDGRYVRRSADGLLERREDWDRKQGWRWHTEELLKEFTGRHERPLALGFCSSRGSMKAFTLRF